MKFKFNFHQVDASEALEQFIQEEMAKYGRHLLTEGTCQIFFRKGRYDCQVQVDVNSPWGHFKSSATGDTFYSAAEEAAYKLGKQFQKTKEKHQQHKKPARSKHERMQRLNSQLEYDNSPYPTKKVS